MTDSDSTPPDSSETSAPGRPRLLINGVPVRPEDLGRHLPVTVQRRLSTELDRADRTPEYVPIIRKRRPLWMLGLGAVLGLAALVLAVWFWWK
ncbi:hypothetical protein [Cystobacter ferrugineus]|uniref:Uncharacterized protein n=1 Tax=Cystobacter ferrugineus TaxID=83449 RepID=A0A1L9AX55_9BACT|nr:hypothetical protein [Cystobacter ferrugineus]OJH34595.1 hypothetical protein BON30_43155 [Cystobacter ferrugineus]